MNMNKPLSILLMIVALGVGTTAHAQFKSIVTVDMKKLFDDYYKTPTARAKLEETRDQFATEFKNKQEDLKKQVEELNQLREEQDRPEYTPEVREEKRKTMNEKLASMQRFQRELEEYRRSHQEILQQQSMRMREGLLEEITEVVKIEAKQRGLIFVLDRSGNTLNGMPGVVFSDDSLDITADILKILNANAPDPIE